VAERREDLRAADVDRQFVADRLKAALDEGRLSLHEYDDRLKETYAARTYGDLDKLRRTCPARRVPSSCRPRRGTLRSRPRSSRTGAPEMGHPGLERLDHRHADHQRHLARDGGERRRRVVLADLGHAALGRGAARRHPDRVAGRDTVATGTPAGATGGVADASVVVDTVM
jgi:hypothetical protein